MPSSVEQVQAVVGDRYRIEREIGAGGMATVYLAVDLKHGRQVAVKVLDSGVTAAMSAERFLREIQLIASLQHPHVLPLHDSGEADGVLYYIMPFVKGESLRARLNRGTMIPVAEAVRLATEVAEALECAHRHGVVHRDVKPENILLSDGHALVADFGIARAVSDEGGARLTQTGSALGTPTYMSPEQITESTTVDGRSDVYSLGCVLYELLAGIPPFTGPNAQAVMVKHVTGAVSPPRRSGETIPPGVLHALLRALAKEPAERYARAADFAHALRIGTASPVPSAVAAAPAATIVVLPFENASPDPNDAYFSTGLTDEVISDLSKVKAIRVISRQSSMQLRGTTKDLRTIARELNVRYALTGSVRRAGDALRIVVELVDTGTDTSIWSEKYTGSVANVFELQEQLSRQIAAALKVTVTPEESLRLVARPGDDPRTLRAIVAAREAFYSYDPIALERAKVVAFETLADVGDNPRLLAWLAMMYVHTTNVGRWDAAVLAAADRMALKAIALAPEMSEGYCAKAYAESWIHGARAAVPWYRRSVERERSAESLTLAYWAAEAGVSLDEVDALSKEAVERDPLAPLYRWLRACCLLWTGDRAGAITVAHELLATGWPLADLIAGGVFLFADDRARAIEHLGRVQVNEHMPVYAEWGPMVVRLLQTGAVTSPSPALLQFCAHADPWAAEWMATYYALAGDRDEALKWVGTAIDRGFTNDRWWSELNPIMARYRDNAEFEALIARARHMRETEPV